MKLAHRVKRSLVAGLAGAMVLALLPAGVAAADVIDTDGLDACDGAEGLVDFNDALGFFESNIECMAAYGITVGDADGNFNSAGSVTRQQMALFIARLATQALNGDTEIPESTDDAFDDIAGVNPPEARDAINFLESLGIVQGVGGGEYDPSGIVTRQQMASYVARAHVALGVDFTGFEATPGVFGDEDDIASVHLDNVLLLADVGVVEGDAAGNYNPANPVTRGQMSAFIVRSIAVLDAQDLWNGEFVVEGEIGENETFTDNPELVEVTRSGDIVTFRFDQNVPGKSLDFFNTAGVPGSLAAGDEVSYYTGPRLYDVDGTAYYPIEAGIFGNEIRARYDSATIVAAAVRAGVYEDTVQNAVGRSNPASDFPLSASVLPPDEIDPYYPQLTFVGNLRDTEVTPAEILVDYTLTFADATTAEAVLGLVLPNVAEVDPSDFAIAGSAGQVFRAIGISNATQSGANVTVTVVMDPAIEDVPVSQLARGIVDVDTFDTATIGFAHILLSSAYGTITATNGTTSDPDLRAVERGPGANQLRFIFDEGVSVPAGITDNPFLYTVTTNAELRVQPDSIGRSLIAADEAQVMVATFTTPVPGFATVSDYLDEVTAAFVDAAWTDAARDVVAFSAARGTNQVGSQQLGWALPAQTLVTPVQPEVPADPTPGVTELPDLVSVTKAQNEVTENWSVTFTFDQTDFVAGTAVDFSLYDAEGVRFSTDSRSIGFATGTTASGQTVFTFGPDESTLNPVFTNEQIAAAVLGTVQDSDATLINSGLFGGFEPAITEGHDGVS